MPRLEVIEGAHGGRPTFALMAALCVVHYGCSSSGSETGTVEFTLTPEGGDSFVVEVEGSTHAPTTGACELDLLDFEGENRYVQWGIGGNCVGYFDAQIEHAGTVYLLLGQTLREFGTGTGPFASGTYTTEDATELGTFTFYELDFHTSD